MQDYIIFHPRRSTFRVEGIASVQQAVERQWVGTIHADPSHPDFGENEDPYVWDTQWLYSYCHATQLRRNFNKRTAFVDIGSRLFFCENKDARNGKLTIDTVFVVGERHVWESVGAVPPKSIPGAIDERSEVYQRHFRHGINEVGGGHRGKYTYTASHQDPKRSFLPLDELGEALTVSAVILMDVSTELLRSRVPAGQTSHTLRMSRRDADTLYQACEREAHTRVFKIIRALGAGEGGASCLC
jgi:hypothetical protein